MEYEVHITVRNVSDIEKFKSDCASINIKPILIETENKTVKDNQVMTSSKHKGENYINTVNKISSLLVSLGYNIVREKVEIKPIPEKHKDFKYYESHFRLKLPKGFNMQMIKDLCDAHGFHLSKNLFKTDENYIYQMCTYRNNYISFLDFNFHLGIFSKHLSKTNIKCDKIEIEECVYDSNERVDYTWMQSGHSNTNNNKLHQ